MQTGQEGPADPMPSLWKERSGYCLVMMLLAGVWGVAIPAWGMSLQAQRLNEAAAARTAQGQYEEAAELFSQALGLSPGDPVLQKNLARLRTVMGHRLLRAGLLSRAQEQYQAAFDLEPNETAALLGLGDVRLWQREPRIAAEFYRRVIALEPQNAEAYDRLGEAYNHLGDLGAALKEWEWALALRPNDAGLRQRMEQLQREQQRLGGFRSQDSQHFTVSYDGQRREDLGRELLQILERAYVDVGYELGAYPPHAIQTIFYSADLASGSYHLLDGKIRVALRGPAPGDPMLRAILYHEYTHALVFAVTQGNNPPLWVHEGLAVQMEKNVRAAAYRDEAFRMAGAGTPPSPETTPYVYGSVAIGHWIDRYGMATIRRLLHGMEGGLPFRDAFQEAFGVDLTTFQQGFRDLLVRGN
jgi:tetratricopeptide (TPR) repeat protein